MKPMENPLVPFNAKLKELAQLFAAVVSQNKDKPPSEVVVTKNDSLVVRVGLDYWACPLSSKECNFLEALLQNSGTMDRNDVKCYIKPFDDRAIRNLLKSINRKLRVKQMPVSLQFVGWVISIEITLF
jgi:hypothetical protein